MPRSANPNGFEKIGIVRHIPPGFAQDGLHRKRMPDYKSFKLFEQIFA
jgi:hypothetical protein